MYFQTYSLVTKPVLFSFVRLMIALNTIFFCSLVIGTDAMISLSRSLSTSSSSSILIFFIYILISLFSILSFAGVNDLVVCYGSVFYALLVCLFTSSVTIAAGYCFWEEFFVSTTGGYFESAFLEIGFLSGTPWISSTSGSITCSSPKRAKLSSWVAILQSCISIF